MCTHAHIRINADTMTLTLTLTMCHTKITIILFDLFCCGRWLHLSCYSQKHRFIEIVSVVKVLSFLDKTSDTIIVVLNDKLTARQAYVCVWKYATVSMCVCVWKYVYANEGEGEESSKQVSKQMKIQTFGKSIGNYWIAYCTAVKIFN